MSTPAAPNSISVKNVETTLNEGLSTNYPSGTSKLTFNDGLVRTLAARPSGSISMNDMRNKAGPLPAGTFIRITTCIGSSMGTIVADGRYGETAGAPILNSPLCAITASLTISSNTTNYTLNPSKVSGYSAGKTTVTFTVNSGVYLYSTNTVIPALTVNGFIAGDVINIINNGFIMGMGGNGAGSTYDPTSSYYGDGKPPSASIGDIAATSGGSAISINCAGITVTNNSYIGGGGGGGGRACSIAQIGYTGALAGGGGGAGGGVGGAGAVVDDGNWSTPGGGYINQAPPGQVGENSTYHWASPIYGGTGGGGGGRIFPGTGGGGGYFTSDSSYTASVGKGGGAGGGGGLGFVSLTAVVPPGNGGAGGAGGAAGSNGYGGSRGDTTNAGGGGGWGASGGNPSSYAYGGTSGAPGGKAIQLNGYSVTRNGSGTTYGGVS